MNDDMMMGLDQYEEVPPPPAPAAHFPVPMEDPEVVEPWEYDSQVSPPWNTALALDVALGIASTDEILDRHDLSTDEYQRIVAHPLFIRQVAQQAREIVENGLSFRTKAKVQAEMYLLELDKMVMAPTTEQKVKLEAIKYVTKVADLEPKVTKEEGSNGPTVNIQINLQ